MIKEGQVVRVRNQRLNGESFIEGYAKVIRVIDQVPSAAFAACEVVFPDDAFPVFRWIDTEDQLNIIQE